MTEKPTPTSTAEEAPTARKVERNRQWAEENRAALEAHAVEVARHGLPLTRYRTF